MTVTPDPGRPVGLSGDDGRQSAAAVGATPVHRRLAAILVADVVGYSRMMEFDEPGTHARLMALHARIVKPAVAAGNGEIVKNLGDGFLATFDSCHDALRCARKIQADTLAAEAGMPEAEAISFRIGINVADVIVDDGDIYGEGVNIAARLQTYAEPGGIVMSGAALEQAGALIDRAPIDLGDLHLRNLIRPIRAYSLSPPGALRQGMATVSSRFELRPSIVVLPFRTPDSEPGESYFSEGIVDEIIHALSGLRELFVISRGSTLGYRTGPIDVRRIGEELGVRYVLHGSVRRAGPRIRLVTELSDAETGTILVADRYDGEMEDIFDLQTRISQRVVSLIAPQVRERELQRATRKHPQNMTAYDHLLQALGDLHRMDYEAFSRARGSLQQAMSHDPAYALAYSYAAYWHLIRVAQGWSNDVAADGASAARLASDAIRRDHNDALALAISGHVHSYALKDYEAAARLLEQAIEVEPNCSMAWMLSSATCGYLGETQKAVLRAEHAIRLSPLDPHVFWQEHMLSQAHYLNGNFDEAVAWARRSSARNERVTANLRILAASLVAIGRLEEAREVVLHHRRLDPGLRIGEFVARTPVPGAARDLLAQRLRAAGMPD